jgi:YD repeat-containing protein
MKTKRLRMLFTSVSLLLASFAVHSDESLAQGCKTTDPQVFCDTVTTACPARPGFADALCSGGLVTNVAGIFHNSHKFINGSLAAVRDFDLGPNTTMFPWVERDGSDVVLYSADGSPTRFIQANGRYESEHSGAGDLRWIVSVLGGGYVVKEPSGSETTFGRIARTGEYLPTESKDMLGLKTSITYPAGASLPDAIIGPDQRRVTIQSLEAQVKITDPDGQTTTYKRDGAGRIVEIILPSGKAIKLGWDTISTTTEPLHVITNLLDEQGLGYRYTYNVQKDDAGRLHGVLRSSRDVVAAHLYTYTERQTSVENAQDEKIFESGNNGGTRQYEPMGYMEYIFATNGQGPWAKYVTRINRGLTPVKTFFAGSVEQDAMGRVTKTIDRFGYKTEYRYASGVPFPSEIYHSDGRISKVSRASKEMAYLPTQILFTASQDTITSQGIQWAGVGRPKQITAQTPGGNSGLTSTTIEYSGNLPIKVTTFSERKMDLSREGAQRGGASFSSGDRAITASFDGKGYLSTLIDNRYPVSFTRSVNTANGDITQTAANSWFTFAETTSLNGQRKQTFKAFPNGDASMMGRVNLEKLMGLQAQGKEEYYQLANPGSPPPATVQQVETQSGGGPNSCSQSCKMTHTDGSWESCDNTGSCAPDGNGGESCTQETTADDSRVADTIPTNTPTPTATPTKTATATATATPTVTPTPTCLANQKRCPTGCVPRNSSCPCAAVGVVPVTGQSCCGNAQVCSSQGGKCANSCCGDGVCTRPPESLSSCFADCCTRTGSPVTNGQTCCSGLAYNGRCVDSIPCAQNGASLAPGQDCCIGLYRHTVNNLTTCRQCVPAGLLSAGVPCCPGTAETGSPPRCVACQGNGVAIVNVCCQGLASYNNTCRDCAPQGAAPKVPTGGSQLQGCCSSQNLTLSGGICQPACAQAGQTHAGRTCCLGLEPCADGTCKTSCGSIGSCRGAGTPCTTSAQCCSATGCINGICR